MVAICSLLPLMAASVLAQGVDLPDASSEIPTDPPADELLKASFGTDLSVGMGAGGLLGGWAVPGVHGLLMGRYDGFIVRRSTPGPRLGVTIFASTTALHLQEAEEQEGEVLYSFPFSFTEFGALAGLRFDPALPWSGLFSFGFSRMDLDVYWGGPLAAPFLVFEAGARRRLDRRGQGAFADGLVRMGWSSRRTELETLEDWWLVQGVILVGWHAR